MTQPRMRIGRLDIALAVLLTAVGALLMYGNITDPQTGYAAASDLALPAFFVVTAPLLWRSVKPNHALAGVFVALGLHSIAFGYVVRCGVAFPTIALLTFASAARLDRRDALVGLGLGLATAMLVGVADATGFGVVTAGVPLTLIAWGIGRVAHSRAGIATELADRNAQLTAARDERARLEVATDRAELSGELDTLLQRRLHDLGTLADRGPASVADGSATAVLVDIERGSRETLDEMRRVVGQLRHDADHAPTAPQPTLTSIEGLVVQAKGADARLTFDGNPRALPAGVELSAYRVVEHLLGALRDAPGVEVRVGFGDDALEIGVAGPARRRGEMSAALDRARERVELHRGSLRTSTQGGRAEAVAQLPLVAA